MAEIRSYVYDEKKRCYVRPDGPLVPPASKIISKWVKLRRWALIAASAAVLIGATIFIMHLLSDTFTGVPTKVQDLNVQ